MNEKIKNKIRLFVEMSLAEKQSVTLDVRRSHYICNVMRLPEQSVISCFNGRDGEFDCRLEKVHKRECVLEILKQTKPLIRVPDVWLLFAPVKKDCTDFIVEKAVELGVSKILPIITRHTMNKEIRQERFCAQAVEAAEQCRRVEVPEVTLPQTFEELLKNWDKSRLLYFMDETGGGQVAAEVFKQDKGLPAALFIGPEGGFSSEELSSLRQSDFAKAISLGPRILRAETAVAASLSVWQAVAGDWMDKKEK